MNGREAAEALYGAGRTASEEANNHKTSTKPMADFNAAKALLDRMDDEEKQEFIRDHGNETWENLHEQAKSGEEVKMERLVELKGKGPSEMSDREKVEFIKTANDLGMDGFEEFNSLR